jgi:hypothetical protein
MASGPSRINIVNFLLLVALLAGAYGVWKFLPHYYTAWQIDRLLETAGTRSYRVVRIPEPARGRGIQEIEDDTRKAIVLLGVDDPAMTMNLSIVENEAIAECDYTVIVEHPYIHKQTVLKMHRAKKVDVKRVEW